MRVGPAFAVFFCAVVLLGCLVALGGLAIVGTSPDAPEHMSAGDWFAAVAMVCVVAALAFTAIVDIIITAVRR